MALPPSPPPMVELAGGGVLRVALEASTMYNQRTAGTRCDVTRGTTVIVRVNGRLGPDGPQNGGSLGAAATATAVP